MGMGDELMASGQARKLHEQTKKRVMIMDAYGRVRQHMLWDRVPYISQHLDVSAARLLDCPGHRPYIKGKSDAAWEWKSFDATPADIVLSTDEEQWAARTMANVNNVVLIESRLKPKASPNKAWIPEYWPEVIGWLRDWGFTPVALGSQGDMIDGVVYLPSPTVRHAAAMMEKSLAYIGVEGFMHHLAAAMRKPAVVLMGGYIGPKQTGYDLDYHRYLTGGVQPCGSRFTCTHCTNAMRSIKPSHVTKALSEVLNR